MASIVIRYQSNKTPLGCGGMGDLHHECAADKSAETTSIYHANVDQIFGGMFPAPC